MGQKLTVHNPDGTLTITDTRTLAEAQAEKFAALAEHRYQSEIGGTIVGGATIPTDEAAQAKICAARVAADANPSYSVQWKVGPGQFVTFSAAQVIAMSDAARAHVQACYDNEAALSAQIMAATTNEAVDAIDVSQGWPS